jgi:hypothetical protein
LAATSIPKLEVGDIDMEGDNKDMEEVLTYRKRPYRCVKRPETTDAANNPATLSLIFDSED